LSFADRRAFGLVSLDGLEKIVIKSEVSSRPEKDNTNTTPTKKRLDEGAFFMD